MRFALGTSVVSAVALALLLGGCTDPSEGYARDLADRVVVGIGDDITPAYPRPLEADYLAAWAIRDPRLPHSETQVDYNVDALSWKGNSGDAAGAEIDLRVRVHVHAKAATFSSAGFDEATVVRCWRLTVFGLHDYDSLKLDEIDCGDRPAAVPSPTPLPDFPEDVEARLTEALSGASAANVDERVRAAFPEDYYAIESDEQQGELVVAIGIPSELLCAVAVQHPDGSVRSYGVETLQAGESSCSPDLYFHPVVTH